MHRLEGLRELAKPTVAETGRCAQVRRGRVPEPRQHEQRRAQDRRHICDTGEHGIIKRHVAPHQAGSRKAQATKQTCRRLLAVAFGERLRA